MRNAYGQNSVAPYALRALEGAPVATPLTWDEVSDGSLTARNYTMDNMFRRLGQKADPWHDMASAAVAVAEAQERL